MATTPNQQGANPTQVDGAGGGATVNGILQPVNPVTTPIPTKAPAAPSPTSPANPVSIIGTSSAASTLQNTMIPAMNSASTGLTIQNAKTSQPFTLGDGSTYDATGKQLTPPTNTTTSSTTPNSGNSGVNNSTTSSTSTGASNTSPSPETTPGTPEYTLLNTPEPGNQYVYDPQGNRLEVPIGNIPSGMTTTPPPAPPTVSGQVTQSNGTTIKQLSDGTYGSYDASGNYQGSATQQQFQDAQTANTLSQNIINLANGTMPLSAAEQAQVNATQASFQELVSEQQLANKNLIGGTTVAMNLYGMGTSVSGLGEIAGAVNTGIQKIADLNSQMAGAVAKMEEGFRTDDMAMFKDAYDVLTGAQKDRQDALDKIKTDIADAADKQRTYNLQLQDQKDTEARNTFDETMANAQLSDSEKKDAFDEFMSKANFTGSYTDPITGKVVTGEQAKQDAIDNYYKGVTASHEAATLAISQAGITGVYTDPATGKQSLTLDAQKTLGANSAAITTALDSTTYKDPKTGKPYSYVDGTNLSDEQKAAAQSQGLIVVSKENMPTMTNLKNIQNGFGSLLSEMQNAGVLNNNFQFTPTGGFTNAGGTKGFLDYRAAGNATSALKKFNNSLYGSDDGSTIKGGLVSTLMTQPNTGDLVQTLKEYAISPKDDAKTMQTKITAITNALQNTTNSILSQGNTTNTSGTPQTVTYNGQTYNVDSNGNMTAQ